MKLCRGRMCSRSCCSSCSSSGIIRERIDPLMLNIALKMGPKGEVVGTDRTLAHLLSNSSSGDLAGAAEENGWMLICCKWNMFIRRGAVRDSK